MGKTVLITGASSGIGEHLALEMAGRGYDLALTARRLDRLEDLKARIGDKVRVEVMQLDVTDTAATIQAVQSLWAKMDGFDIVVANAGCGGDNGVGQGVTDQQINMVNTNVNGLIATIDPAVALMRARGQGGQIVGVASVAGFRGLPGSSVYSGTKSFVITYLQSLRLELKAENIAVTCLSPGFIDTAINQDLGDKRPFLVDVETGAKSAADLIEKRVAHSTVPPWPWTAVGAALKIVPDALMPGGYRD